LVFSSCCAKPCAQALTLVFIFGSGGYGTVVLLHYRLHDPAGAEKVASGRKRERIKKTSWCM